MVQQLEIPIVEAPEVVEEAAPVEEEIAPTPAEEEGVPEADEPEVTEEVVEDEAPADSGAPDLAAQIAELRQELTAVREQKPQRSEEEIRQELQDSLRRQQQQEQDQRRQEQEWREELDESIQAALISRGYTDVPPEAVRQVGERFINKRYDQIALREVGEVRTGLQWLRDQAEGKPVSVTLSPKAARYANDLAESFNAIFQRVRTQVTSDGDFVAKADHDRLIQEAVAADRASRNAKAREGQEALKRPKGQPSETIDRSIAAVNNRIANNLGDETDKRIWRERYQGSK